MKPFEVIEALHQQVRVFVEKEFPEFTVTDVKSNGDTRYVCPLDKAGEIDPSRVEFLLLDITLRFRVQAFHLSKHLTLSCDVYVRNDGQLYLNPNVGLSR